MAKTRRAEFNWKDPEPGYQLIWEQRAERLQLLRAKPELVGPLKKHYAEEPWDFITDWGVTADPRRVELDLDPMMPFVLFDKQREWLQFVMRKWKERRPGLTDKSRDGGLSWLSIGLGCTLCLFRPGMAIGYGSRTEDYVDKIGEPKSLFWKARYFMQELPREFKGGWDPNRHAPHMRILFPATGSAMTGESGDQIGRGARTGIYFVDESAHLPNPKSVDAALSQTTNCRQDISTPKGRANSFATRRWGGKVEVVHAALA
jgi:phage terminase large subunit